MPAERRPYDFDRVFRIVVALLTAAALLWVVYLVREVLIPLAVAFLLAYLLNPVVNFVQRRLKNRAAAVLVTVFSMLVLVLLLVALVVPLIGREMIGLGDTLLSAVRDDSPLVRWANEHLPANISAEIERFTQSEEFQEFIESEGFDTLMSSAQSASGALLQAVRWVFTQIWGIVSGIYALVLGVAGLFIVLLYLIFLLIDYRLLEGTWQDYLPPKYRNDIVAFLREFNAAMSTYFRGQFLVAASVGILFALGFTLIGLKMAVLLGLFIGALNMVPYLQTLGIVPAVLLALLTAFDRQGSLLWLLVGVGGVFIVVQALQDAVLTPRIMGKVTGLRPVVILFAVLFWGKLLGFLGLMLAIPLTCLGVAYYRRLLARQKREHTTIIDADGVTDATA